VSGSRSNQAHFQDPSVFEVQVVGHAVLPLWHGARRSDEAATEVVLLVSANLFCRVGPGVAVSLAVSLSESSEKRKEQRMLSSEKVLCVIAGQSNKRN